MKLTQQAIKDFQKVYLDESSKEISQAEAEEMGTRLLTFLTVIFNKPSNK